MAPACGTWTQADILPDDRHCARRRPPMAPGVVSGLPTRRRGGPADARPAPANDVGRADPFSVLPVMLSESAFRQISRADAGAANGFVEAVHACEEAVT